MRRAMAEAEVGDDVYGEDPTVNRLEARMADRLGTEAALFVPSGTMANQICLHVLTDPGDEILLERSAHIFNYESGAAGLLSGIQLNPIDGEKGLLVPERVEAAIRPDTMVMPPSRVVSVENTANTPGGVVYPLERIAAIAEVARTHDLALHLDGARLWNAAAAHDVPERDYVAPFDLAWVALSKGLGCPAGSIVAGSEALIAEARRTRKRFGGGMRQAGILAAAGLYALDNHRPHLSDDHEKARRLAEVLDALAPFEIDLERVETNILVFESPSTPAGEIVDALADEDVHVTQFGPHTLRITTHRDVSTEDVDTAIDALQAQFG
jgi:threonine aldolase